MASDGLAQGGDVGGDGLVARDGLPQRGELGRALVALDGRVRRRPRPTSTRSWRGDGFGRRASTVSRSAASSADAASWRATASRSRRADRRARAQLGELLARDAVGDQSAQRAEVGGRGVVARDAVTQRVELGDRGLVPGDDLAQLGRARPGATASRSCAISALAASAAPTASRSSARSASASCCATASRSALTIPVSASWRATVSPAAASWRATAASWRASASRISSSDSGSRRPSTRARSASVSLLEVVEAAAIVAGQALGGGALDGEGGELLADGVGAALDLLDALQRRGQFGARGLALALAFALEAGDRLGELDAGGLRGLLVLGADLLELVGDVDAAGEAGLEATGGLGDRLGRARLGGGDGLGQARVGQRLGGRAVALELVEPGGQARRSGLGGGERLAALGLGGLAVEAGALEALQAGELLDAVELGRDAGQRALEVGAKRVGGAIGVGGAALGLAAGLLELLGQPAGDALELVDALDRAQQARDDRGGVVEVAEVALDARVEVGQPLLGLGVGELALGLAAGELGLDPRRGLQRAEDDQRAGRAPALPGLDGRLDAPSAARARRPGAAGACAAASGSSAARRRGPRGRARSRSPRRA